MCTKGKTLVLSANVFPFSGVKLFIVLLFIKVESEFAVLLEDGWHQVRFLCLLLRKKADSYPISHQCLSFFFYRQYDPDSPTNHGEGAALPSRFVMSFLLQANHSDLSLMAFS